MPIARDNSAQIGASTGVSSLSGSFTCSGSDRLLVVFFRRNTGSLSTCTYNGVSLTIVDSVSNSPSTGQFITMMYLINPASGSNTLSCAITGGPTYLALQAISYTGAKQSSVLVGQAGPSGSFGSSKTATVSPSADNAWVAGIYQNDNGGTVTATNSAVKIGSTFANAGSVDMLFDTNGPITPATSTIVGGQSTVSGGQGIIAAAFAPSVASSSSSKLMMRGYT